jgi:tRNA threonylcarbamoyladenosine biosynthesis protein TsaB
VALILALETASERGSVALTEDGKLLGERSLEAGRHAAELLGAVDTLLTASGRELADVGVIALSVGPGSFTGLRVGLASALGLCFASERQIVPVPTLAALALQGGERAPIVPMLDARRGQVYGGVYEPGGRCLRPDAVHDPLPWLGELAGWPGSEPITLLGPGAQLHREEIDAVLGERARLLDAALGQPTARSVAEFGKERFEAGAARPAEEVELAYLRPAEAEQKRCALHGPGKPIS